MIARSDRPPLAALIGTIKAGFWFLLIGVVALNGLSLFRYFEAKLDGGDWITAYVEVQRGSDGEIELLYEAQPVRHVRGLWYATIYNEHGKRLDTRVGHGNYNPKKRERKPWAWDEFFDGRDGLDSPAIPSAPFYVCVIYVVSPLGVDYERESPTRCSETFDPRG